MNRCRTTRENSIHHKEKAFRDQFAKGFFHIRFAVNQICCKYDIPAIIGLIFVSAHSIIKRHPRFDISVKGFELTVNQRQSSLMISQIRQ